MYGRLSDSDFGNQLFLTYLAPYFVGFSLAFYILFILIKKLPIEQRFAISLIFGVMFSFVTHWFLEDYFYVTFIKTQDQSVQYSQIVMYILPLAIIFIILAHFFISRFFSGKQ